MSCTSVDFVFPNRLAARRWAGVCLAAGLAVGAPIVRAGDGGTQSIAEREVGRRNELTRQASDLIQKGNLARKEKDLATAVDSYEQAVKLLPKAPMSAGLRAQAMAAFSEASVARAEELAMQARYDDANATLDAVLRPDWNPEYVRALKLKAQIQDPEVYNPAATPAHLSAVQQVTNDLTLADGHLALGEFDKARDAYNRALAVDRTNTAARRGLERVEHQITQYHKASRDHTRADALRQVDAHWDSPVPSLAKALGGTDGVDRGGDLQAGLSAREKIKAITLPQVQLIDASMTEVVEFLAIQSRTYDTLEADPSRKGVNIVLSGDPALAGKRVTLSLTDVPLSYVLESVARSAGTEVRVEDFVVVFGSGKGAQLTQRTFRVPPGFFTSVPVGTSVGAGTDPFAAGPAKPEESKLAFVRVDPKDFLTQSGVTFPDGSAAFFSPATGVLTVRNTPGNLDLVQTLVEQSGSGVQKLIRIQSTMLEVNQENLEELGFDWLLGAFDLGSNKVFGAGGTTGNQPGDAQSLAQNFPFVPPTPNSSPVGSNPLTAGNRSGNSAIPPASIDALLRGDRTPNLGVKAPAVFGISGVLTDPQFQVVMRGLNQRKGVDLASSPIILAKSGQRAKVEVIREFPYPTEFEPPEIPQDFNNGGNNAIINLITGQIIAAGIPTNTFPVTPTTPTAFEIKKLGHMMEVEATVGADNRTIDIDISPAYSEFEGFVNYGSPIQTYENSLTPTVLTENRIPQPVFRTNKTSGLKVTLWSGNTMVIAGLASDLRTTVEDKTPIFGDLPFVGRFFRSTAQQVRTKVVLFMVKAEVVDPSGEVPPLGTAQN